MWVGLSFICALSWATSDLFSKRAMVKKDADEASIIWVRYLIALPLGLPFLLGGVPHLSARFFWVQLVGFPVEILALILYMRAIRISPLSLTVPFLAFTPVFLMITGFFVLGERPGLLPGVGILLVAAGAYFLSGKGWVPLSAIRREKGSWLMILVSALYALTAALGKVMIQESSPGFFAAYYLIVMTFLLSPMALFRPRKKLRFTRDVWLAGLFHGAMAISHMFAVILTQASYMIALKRMAGVFGVIFGRIFFGEPHLARRLAAAGVMFLGALLVSVG